MKIIWTKTALDSYDLVLTDILNKFPFEEAIKFDLEVERTILRLEEFPEIGSKYRNTIYRRFVVHKLTSIFYRVDFRSNIVYLNFFWLNRDNPLDLTEMLGA